jgi:outer membrane protein assembly factor BamB
MTHSSVMATTVNGVKQYVYCTFQAIVGVRASDGKLLWELPWTAKTAVAPSPTPIGDGRVFITSGYNVGSLMLKIEPDGDGFKAVKLYDIGAEDFESDCHTMVLYKDHLFGVDKRGFLTCLSLDGKIVWKHEGDYKFGLGNWLLADGMLFVIEGDTGMLRLIDADPAGYKPLAEAKLLSGGDVWAPIAYFDGKMIIRDLNKMLCIQVAK